MAYIVLLFFLKPQNPLKNAEFPKETIDFFSHLPDIIDIGFSYNPNPDSSSWGNYEEVDSLLKIEDSCFVVFYSSIDSVVEKKKAVETLQYAHEAIPKLKQLMKDYPYPYKVNNRKLPIYLARNNEQYISIQKTLTPDPCSNSVGIYIFEVSIMGVLTNGIVISPDAYTAFNYNNQNQSFKIVLWHEMNHYVYFTNFDFYSNSEPYLWFTEGCAEYFAENVVRKEEVDRGKVSDYSLTNNILNSDAYWIGYTAFKAIEKPGSTISDMVYASYKNNIEQALQKSMNISLEQWDVTWKNYIRSNK